MAVSARFDGVDFTVQEVTKVTPALEESLGQGFRCKRGEFGTFWKKGRIAREERASIGRCWVLIGNGLLAGYITLLTDKLQMENPPLGGEGITYSTMPAVKIGLLAADQRAKGAGTRLVEWALEYVAEEIVPKVGVRFVTVDAFYDKDPGSDGKHYDASGFYQKIGFNFVNPEESLPPEDGYRTMYFDLKPLIEVIQAQDEEEEQEQE
jgi:GNAT superfamily N-acetyltransferase